MIALRPLAALALPASSSRAARPPRRIPPCQTRTSPRVRRSTRPPAPCEARPTATCACSRAFPTRSRRSDRCAGSRRFRSRAGRACATPPSSAPACYQPPPRLSNIYAGKPMPLSEDCLTLNVWAPADAQERAGVRLDLRRRAAVGLQPRADVRRQAPGRARRRGRLDQLPTRRARLARASRAQRGIAAGHLGQLRPARPDPRADVGEGEHRVRSAAIRPTSPSPANPRARSA